MNLGKKSIGIAATAIGGLAVMTAAPSLANHSWGGYHWERTTDEITVPVIDNTSSSWTTYVQQANADWNASQYINSPLSKGPRDTACAHQLDQIHVCNSDYGATGWVGIASISVTRGRTTHILAGSTKLNDYYFNRAPYNNPATASAWRLLVSCQEIGHDYGLDHQDETFSNTNLGTCMDYTDDPDGSIKGQLSNTEPNNHDYEQLVTIYTHSHSDGGTTSPGPGNKGGGKKLGVPGNSPAEWGQAIGFDAQGRANVYKREMAGYDIITHVTWAIGEGSDGHQERGPRQHSGDIFFNN